MRRSANSAVLWSSALLVLPAVLAGCAKTSTYGTGQMPEAALFREMTGNLLSKNDKPPIDYQPRAPLVMPPAAGQLPPPAETAAAASADWPIDRDTRLASLDARGRNAPYNNQAEFERLRPLSGVMPEAPRTARYEEGGKADYYNIVHGRQQREAFRQAIAEESGYGRTERRYLTDPPTAYREPEATAPADFEDVKRSEEGNFFSRWWRRR